MGEHKRIVIEDYPVENLPEELRGGIETGHRVTVTVEDRVKPAIPDFETKLTRFWGACAYRGTTAEEAVARVRALRDEWDDR